MKPQVMQQTLKDDELQGCQLSSNECASCFGLYNEDIDPETRGATCDWVQCTNEDL